MSKLAKKIPGNKKLSIAVNESSLTITEISRLAKINRSTLYRFIWGTSPKTVKTVYALMRILECDKPEQLGFR